MTTDAEAYAIARAANPNLSEAATQFILAVARGEGGYGDSWEHPDQFTQSKSKEFGLTGFEGAGSNNWGSVQGTGSAGSFQHVDRHADGSWYVGTFKKYKTPAEGFISVESTILGGGLRRAAGAADIKAALDAGDARAAVFAMHSNGYFELGPEAYLGAVERNHKALCANAGLVSALRFPLAPGRSPSGVGSLASGSTSLGGPSVIQKPPFVAERFTTMPVIWLGAYGPPVQVLCMCLAVPVQSGFDGVLKALVMKWQEDHGLVKDGVVGPKTWEALLNSVKS